MFSVLELNPELPPPFPNHGEPPPLDPAVDFTNITVASNTVGNKSDGRTGMALRKAGGNWVAGNRFFNREVEIEALIERVEDGTHTLVTAQRRMGKTSLVRELLRRLGERGDFETVFVDLEDASTAADAVVEIAAASLRARAYGPASPAPARSVQSLPG